MATIKANATGNWSAGATWVGGVAPGPGDVAVANGKTVTIDGNVTCTEIRNDTTGGATAGGSFTLNAGVTLTANLIAGAATLLNASYNSPGNASIVGNVTAGGSNGIAVNFNGTGTLNVTGHATAGSVANADGIRLTSTGTLNLTGNALGATADYAYGVNQTGNGTTVQTGNAVGGSGNASAGIKVSAGFYILNGNATGGSGPGGTHGVNQTGGVVTINGVATGTNNGYGAYNAAGGVMSVLEAVGNDYGLGGSHANSYSGVYGIGSTTVQQIVSGPHGQAGIAGAVFLNPQNNSVVTLRKTDLTTRSLYLSDSAIVGFPSITDVRAGTVFDNGNLTGTCHVPPAESVLIGVPVGSQVGNCVMSSANMYGACIAALTDQSVKLTSDYDAAKSAASQSSVSALHNFNPAQDVVAHVTVVDTLTNAPSSGATPAEIWTYSARSLTEKTGFGLVADYDAAKSAASQSSINALVTPPSSSVIAQAVRTELGTELGRLDEAVSAPKTLTSAYDPAKRAASQFSVDSIPVTPLLANQYVAPDNFGIAAIKAKTDALPANPAAVGSAMILTADYDAAKSAASQSSINALHNFNPASDSVAHVILVDSLANAPSVPSGEEIASAVRTNLAVELGRVDEAISAPKNLTSAYAAAQTAASQSSINQLHNLTAQQVWEYATRTITGGGVGGGLTAQEVWEYISAALPHGAEQMLAFLKSRLEAQVAQGSVIVIPAPPTDTQTTAWTRCWDAHGAPEQDVAIQIKLVGSTEMEGGDALDSRTVVAQSNEDGLASVLIRRGSHLQYEARRGSGKWIPFSGTDTESLQLPDLLGN